MKRRLSFDSHAFRHVSSNFLPFMPSNLLEVR
jgi:hypothetical protein